MICYMPFTCIEEPHLKVLTGTFGKITVYSPAEDQVSEQMRQWEQMDRLDIRHPGGLDGGRLGVLMQEYKAWAEIHQGNIGEMAGFFKSRQGRIAMMDDTNPTQISHQVRHYGEPPGMESADPLRDAALFLSLAQEFDAQQYLMDREMDAVQALENRMMQQIAGDAADANTAAELGQTPHTSSRDQALSPDMISQRVRAWSFLAQQAGGSPLLYITMSPQVSEHILEFFDGAVELYNQPLSTPENEAVMPPDRMLELIQAMAEGAGSETKDPLPEHTETTASGRRLTIHKLSGIAPPDFLKVLSGQVSAAEAVKQPAMGPSHTLIGLVGGN